jgi:RHS repeat-associated protein
VEQVSGTGGVLYFHHDQLGSTRLLTDTTGVVQASYTYDAYGNVSASTGTINNPLGYAGQYSDSESGLIYLRARYYDPSTAQFVSRDPAVATTRAAYAYVHDNPLNAVDPTGMAEACLGVGISGFLGAGQSFPQAGGGFSLGVCVGSSDGIHGFASGGGFVKAGPIQIGDPNGEAYGAFAGVSPVAYYAPTANTFEDLLGPGNTTQACAAAFDVGLGIQNTIQQPNTAVSVFGIDFIPGPSLGAGIGVQQYQGVTHKLF